MELLANVHSVVQAITDVPDLHGTMVEIPLVVAPIFYPLEFLITTCRISLALLCSCLSMSAARGQSCGFWHLPSNLAQFIGCCHGGGHHAPMVITPGARPPHTPRMTIVPSFRSSMSSCPTSAILNTGCCASCTPTCYDEYDTPQSPFSVDRQAWKYDSTAKRPTRGETPGSIDRQHLFSPPDRPMAVKMQ